MIASRAVDVLPSGRRREVRDAVGLALVPVTVALVFGLLLMPRRATPDAVPVPVADRAVLSQVASTDRALDERARREPLPGAVRALGSAIRAFHALEARDGSAAEMSNARRAVDGALVDALATGNGPLIALRATQLTSFLQEVDRFEGGAAASSELEAVAGNFVRSLSAEGWCHDHDVVPTRDVLAVMFKHMWNAFLGLDARPELAPTLDEERLLYAFYLSHPHASRSMREALAAARRGARDASACTALDEAERGALESWRLEHIARLAAIDPAYPADYARGVVAFRRGDYGAASRAFESWVRDHPEGPLAMRARNFLRSASSAERVE